MYRQDFRHRRARNRVYPNVTRLSGFLAFHLPAQGFDDRRGIRLHLKRDNLEQPRQFIQRRLYPTAPVP